MAGTQREVRRTLRVIAKRREKRSASDADHAAVSDGKAALHRSLSEYRESLLDLFSDCLFRWRMELEANHTWSSGRRKAEHIRKVHIESEEDTISRLWQIA